jgi:hypothetical protein
MISKMREIVVNLDHENNEMEADNMEVERITDKTANNVFEKTVKAMATEAVSKKMNDFVGNTEMVDDDGFEIEETEEDDEVQPRRNLFSSTVQPQKKSEMFSDEDRKKIKKKADEARKSQDWDIFMDVGEEYYRGENPLMVKYDVCLGNITLGTKVHPYSWEKLQAEYTPIHGSGKYTVKCKDPITSQILKVQPKTLAKLESNERAISEKESGNGITLSEIARMEQIRAEREETRRANDEDRADRIRRDMEAKNDRLQSQLERERKDSEEKNRLWTEKMLDMAKPKEGGMNDFLKEFLSSPLAMVIVPKILGVKKDGDSSDKDEKLETYKMIRDIQDENRKTIEAITKSFEKQITTLTETIREVKADKKEEGGLESMLSTFKMIKSIEDEGREKAEKMYEWRREIEAEKKEEREENNSGKSDSMLERLAMTALPIFAGAMAQRQSQPQQPRLSQTTRPNPVQAPRIVTPVSVSPTQPRGAVSSTGNQTIRPRTNPNQERVIRDQVSQTKTNPSAESSIRSEGRVLVRQASPRGVTGVSDLMSEARRDIKEEIAMTSVVHEENISYTLAEATSEKDEANITRITSSITPIVFEALGLMAGAESQEALVKTTAEKSIIAFKEDGIELSTVLRDFDEETLNAILVMLPTEYHELLKELKNEIILEIKSEGISG